MPMNLSVAKLSDVGRTRDHQEDFVDYLIPEDLQSRQRKGVLYVVADGMGGHNAGEVASRGAVERIIHEYYNSPVDDVPTSLVQAIQNANRMIHQQAQASPAQSGMGTTAVAAVIRGRELYIANVGDSRAYMIRNGQIKQITVDHSWVEEQVRAGILTRDQAKIHPQRNVITRALGSKPEVDVDTFRGEMREGDVVVLCSDGLTGHVADAEILSVASRFPPEEAVQRLVQRANELGGSDNISVVVIKALPEGAAQQPVVQPAEAAPATAQPAKATPAAAATPARRLPLIIPLGAAGLVLVILMIAVAALLLRPSGPPSPTPTTAAVEPPPATAAAVATAPGLPSPQATDTVPPGEPTSTLAPTPTPAPPTATPTATPVWTPTSVPTPTPPASLKLAAPRLLEPADEASFATRQDNVTFQWSKASRPLGPNEYYVLIIHHKKGYDRTWTKKPSYSVGDDKRWLPDEGPKLEWQVVVARQRTGEPNEDPTGAEISEYSETRTVYWNTGEPGEEGGGGGGSSQPKPEK